MTDPLTILCGDWVEKLRELPDEHFHCVVTSPPYWSLRNYNMPGQLGLESELYDYINKIVVGFREVWRVVRNDGVVWVNLGDCYASNGGHTDTACNHRRGQYNLGNRPEHDKCAVRARPNGRLKKKDLVGLPWRIAFALQEDRWYLRSDIIFSKRNPMPESVTDRPTRSHEFIFLLTKSPHYFYDAEAVKLPASPNSHLRVSQASIHSQTGGSKQEDYRNNTMVGKKSRDRSPVKIIQHMARKLAEVGSGTKNNGSFDAAMRLPALTANLRTVWTVTTQPLKQKHYAAYPPKLIEPCILAGTSAKGCCGKCGAPWKRVLFKEKGMPESFKGSPLHTGKTKEGREHLRPVSDVERTTATWTSGWQPTCTCYGQFVRQEIIIPPRATKEQVAQWGADRNGEYNGQNQKDYQRHQAQAASTVKQRIIDNATKPRVKKTWVYHPDIPLEDHPIVPCRVLDPFGGSGTTGMVALWHGRHATLIELNPEYVEMARERCKTPRPTEKKKRQPKPEPRQQELITL